MAEDKIVISHPAHPSAVLSNLYGLYLREDLVDISIQVKNGSVFRLHKCILAASSKYFCSLFSGDPRKYNFFQLSDVDEETLKLVIEFLYTGHISLFYDQIEPLYRATKFLQIDSFFEACKDKLLECQLQQTYDTNENAVENVEVFHVETHELEKQPEDTSLRRSKRSAALKRRSWAPATQTSPRSCKRESVLPAVGVDIKCETVSINFPLETNSDIEEMLAVAHEESSTVNKSPDLITNQGICDTDNHRSKQSHKRKRSAETDIRENTTFPTGIDEAKIHQNGNTEQRVVIKEEVNVDKTSEDISMETPRRHAKHTDDKPHHTCGICKLAFFHFSTLKCHKATCHGQSMNIASQKIKMYKMKLFIKKTKKYISSRKSHKCSLCSSVFNLYSQLIHHICVKHNLYRQKCTFKNCKVVCSNSKNIQLHQRSKHKVSCRGKKRHSRASCWCLRTFKYKKNLEHHKSTTHSSVMRTQRATFTCNHCNKIFPSLRKLTYHSYTHNNRISFNDACDVTESSEDNFPYKCKICSDHFRSKSGIVNHVRKVHGGHVIVSTETKAKAKRFQCEQMGCAREFGHLKQLSSHMYNQHPEVSEQHCDLCDYRTIIMSSFKFHMKTKHKPPEQTTCDICGYVVRKPFMLPKHKWKNHNIQDPNVKTHPCPVEGCDFIAFQRTNLTVHMRRHSSEKPYTCDVCGRKVKTERTLQLHMAKVHMRIRPFICDQCGATYGEEHELKTHIARHETDKKYKCDMCPYATCDKANYSSHMYSQHRVKPFETGKIFTCHQCDYSTDRRMRLVDHQRKHDNIKAYKCELCDKEFGTQGSLRTHNKWLHSDVVYNCSLCDHTTKTAYHLKEHVRVVHTHRHVKPFKCSYCPYTSAVSGNCRKHIMKKHKGKEVKWVKVCDRYSLNVPASAAAAIKKKKVPTATLR